MKIFDLLTQLTKAIGDRFIRLVTPQPLSGNNPTTSMAERTRVKQKTVRKRKSFRSFVRDHDSQVLSNSSRRNRRKARCPPHLKPQRQFKKQVFDDSNCSSNEAHLQEKNTNEAPHPVSLDPPPLFIDKDGLEISIIEERDNRFDALNNSAESDDEILKFVFGEGEKPQQHEEVNEQPPIEPIKEWWRQALEDHSDKSLESGLNDRVSSIRYCASDFRVQGQESAGSRLSKKRKTKRIRHAPRPKHLKRPNGLRVITLVDLVENQDSPRLFHIPLKQE